MLFVGQGDHDKVRGFLVEYGVRVVADGELPVGVLRAIVEMDDGSRVLLLSEECARSWGLVRAYEASRRVVPAPVLLYAV